MAVNFSLDWGLHRFPDQSNSQKFFSVFYAQGEVIDPFVKVRSS